ncbi:helix-turn-helix domain-containing protein [Hathewaya massiliensis]|uniref:helix-turn-helix domain-containing protein n=1 Tax=Hathewaya massiliensis TaxID=1964382 RepID=UPI00115BBD35|nr:helix-turn-helix transcriptional regulator [Hathewaya massiliensis]
MSITGDRIKNERRNLKLTQEQLGEKVHVTKQSVSKWENGTNLPEPPILNELAKIFDCTVDYLLGNTDVRNRLESSLFDGTGHTSKALNKLFDNEKEGIDENLLLNYALKVLKENYNNLESKEDRSAAETTLSILNALIDTGALNEDNWNEDTMNIIKSAINMYIKNRKKTTSQE